MRGPGASRDEASCFAVRPIYLLAREPADILGSGVLNVDIASRLEPPPLGRDGVTRPEGVILP